MLVLFKENYDCVIIGIANIRLGDMLCELLNYDINVLFQLEKNLVQALNSIDPSLDINAEGTVGDYLSVIKKTTVLVNSIKKQMKSFPFYRYNKDVETAFVLFDSFAYEMSSQLKGTSKDCIVLDAEIPFDLELFKDTITETTKLIKIFYNTIKKFQPIVDSCLLYDIEPLGLNPLQRLKQFGLDKFNSQIASSIKNTRTTPTSSLSLMYEFVGDDDQLSLLQCFDFGTLPQYIYHETMKMISANLYIRECKNCGKYFVIYGERILEYCNNVPSGETKPCSVIGPLRRYGQKVKTDPILEIYTRAYKKYVARKRSGTITSAEFKDWTVKSRKLRDKAYKENISPEEFTTWMK